jgi:hypothetical protein
MLSKNPVPGTEPEAADAGDVPPPAKQDLQVSSTVVKAEVVADLLERADLLRAQLRRECLAMSAYALSTGKTIPPEAAEGLSLLEVKFGNDPLTKLVELHGQLTVAVAPALPGSIADLYRHAARAKFGQRLAPVPIARSMALVGLIFVVIFFGIGLFSEINNQNLNDDMLKSSGWKLLLVQLFLLSAVGCRCWSVFCEPVRYSEIGRKHDLYADLCQ